MNTSKEFKTCSGLYYVTLTYLSSYSYMSVLILLRTCPHTPTYVSSYSYVRVLVLLHARPHTAIYVSSYSYARVLILLYMCPHITLLSSSQAPLVAFSYVCCGGITASLLHYFTDTECMYPPKKHLAHKTLCKTRTQKTDDK